MDAPSNSLSRPTRGRGGAVSSKAVKSGVIKQGGWGNSKNPQAHYRPVRIWRSLVCANPAATTPYPEVFPVLKEPYGTTWERVTPEIAKDYVDTWPSAEFQRVRHSQVARYALDMQHGRWEKTYAPITFDGRGKLIDGIHRLLALIEAKATVDFLVARPATTEKA
jgi:hypothetical protein